MVGSGEGKRGKYLGKKTIRSTEEKNEKKESFGEGKLMVTPTDRPTNQLGEYRAMCLFES